MKKNHLLIGILLSLAVIGYVLFKLDWEEVFRTLLRLEWKWVLLGFLVYLLNYLLRAVRFRSLLALENPPFHHLLGVTNLYGMYLYLMPAKFGEVTFPVLVKQRLGIDLSTSTGSLIVARVFDFLTISLILPIVLLIYWEIVTPAFKIASLAFCFVVFSLFAFFLWALKNPARLAPLFEIKSSTRPVIQRLQRFLSRVYQAMIVLDQQGSYLRLLILTAAIWISINSNFYLITLALGYSFNFFQIVVVSIIMVPVTLFPIQGFANLGAHEFGWVTAFALFGYAYLDALNIAVSSHIVYVIFVLLLGLSGLLLLSWRGKGSPPREQI